MPTNSKNTDTGALSALGIVIGAVLKLGIIIAVVAAVIAVIIGIEANILSWAWNLVVPSTFNGPELQFWPAVGIIVLLDLAGWAFRKFRK